MEQLSLQSSLISLCHVLHLLPAGVLALHQGTVILKLMELVVATVDLDGDVRTLDPEAVPVTEEDVPVLVLAVVLEVLPADSEEEEPGDTRLLHFEVIVAVHLQVLQQVGVGLHLEVAEGEDDEDIVAAEVGLSHLFDVPRAQDWDQEDDHRVIQEEVVDVPSALLEEVVVEGDAPILYLEAALVVHALKDQDHSLQCLDRRGQEVRGAGADHTVVQSQDHIVGQCPGLDPGHVLSPLALAEVVGEVLVQTAEKEISAKIVGKSRNSKDKDDIRDSRSRSRSPPPGI
jgi:hypothetical protein